LLDGLGEAFVDAALAVGIGLGEMADQEEAGLVVTSVPKVPFWKACYFNKLRLRLPDNILICLEIQLFPFGDAIQGRMYRQVSGQAVTGQSHT
jgi:hypothetical protein